MSLPHPRARRAALLLSLLLAAGVAGCGSIGAQNPSGLLKPVNAVADGDDERVILKGHDVVAYFTLGRHQLGQAQHKSVYEGVTFRFASAEHKALFDKEPTRYLPQFGGYCANGIVYAIPWGGDADSWLIHEGKLYIFGGAMSKAGFELDRAGNLALAHKYWKEEVAGSNSFLQRTKRMVNRVPHYKSGDELAREVMRAGTKPGG